MEEGLLTAEINFKTDVYLKGSDNEEIIQQEA